MNRFARCAVVVIGLAAGLATRGEASTVYASRLDWQAVNPGYTAADLSGVPEHTLVNQLDAFGTSLVFDADLERVDVPSSWSSWSGGAQPNLLYHFSSFSLTATFAGGPFTGGFGFEVQPDLFGVFPMMLTLSDGHTLTQLVDGFGGAAFFGWTGTDITSFTISCVDCSFALGQIAVQDSAAAVPEPATIGLLGLGLVAIARVTGGRTRP